MHQMMEKQRSHTLLRSVLFVPATVPRFVERAPEANADAVCLDLEDSVPEAEKAQARTAAANAIDSMPRAGYALFARVNAAATGLLEDDLSHVVRPGLDGIVLPKANADDIRRADHYLTLLERQRGMERAAIAIVPLIETAAAVLEARETAAASERIVALSLGAEDLSAEIGLDRGESGAEIELPRSLVVLAATAAGTFAIDTPEPDFRDAQRLEREASRARALGFRGKYCIHPEQVAIVNRMFSPTAEEVAEAMKVVRLLEAEGLAKGRAAVEMDGKMIDTPTYRQAKRLLQWAEAAGIGAKE